MPGLSEGPRDAPRSISQGAERGDDTDTMQTGGNAREAWNTRQGRAPRREPDGGPARRLFFSPARRGAVEGAGARWRDGENGNHPLPRHRAWGRQRGVCDGARARSRGQRNNQNNHTDTGRTPPGRDRARRAKETPSPGHPGNRLVPGGRRRGRPPSKENSGPLSHSRRDWARTLRGLRAIKSGGTAVPGPRGGPRPGGAPRPQSTLPACGQSEGPPNPAGGQSEGGAVEDSGPTEGRDQTVPA